VYNIKKFYTKSFLYPDKNEKFYSVIMRYYEYFLEFIESLETSVERKLQHCSVWKMFIWKAFAVT